MDDNEVVISRRNVKPASNDVQVFSEDTEGTEFYEDEIDSKDTRLTLMEEVYLLGLKDREGYTSFWNDRISNGLRAALMIDLCFRERITLEPSGRRKKELALRCVIPKNDVPTGDMLLDEAYKHIKSNEPDTLKTWIDYLTGDTWNPFKMALQLRNVRERLAKSLADKGVCTTEKQNFIVFDMTTHPVIDGSSKQKLVRRIQDTVVHKWPNNPAKIEKRMLALIILAYRADVLENALSSLNDTDYFTAMKNVSLLVDLDYNAEADKDDNFAAMWATFDAIGG